tara:strand:- start:14006 stop:14191 length:186 start_codon:yes stop_codon:yes gene_type:complete
MEKPILESDVCLETQMHLHLVERYINMLEKRIIDLSHELSASQCQLYIIEQKEQLKGVQKN